MELRSRYQTEDEINYFVLECLQKYSNVVNTPLISIFSGIEPDPNMVRIYANQIENKKKKSGEIAAFEKLMDMFRINPMVAFRAMKENSFYQYRKNILYGFKLIFSSIHEDSYYKQKIGQSVILNSNEPVYLTLFIEAAYVMDPYNDYVWNFLDYANSRNKQIFAETSENIYFTAENIRHIFKNIPVPQRIHLINWFWDQYMYEHNRRRKNYTFASKQVAIMMQQVRGDALWKYLESEQALLDESLWHSQTQARIGLKHFIESVIQEGVHLNYVEIVLGKDNLLHKLEALVDNIYVRNYQKKLAENARLITNKHRQNAYTQLIKQVQQKYTAMTTEGPNNRLYWYNVWADKETNLLNLWNYWQGMKITDVKVMVLGLEWGNLHESNPKAKTILQRIGDIRKGHNQKYYIAPYRTVENSLVKLFGKVFNRDLTTQRYSDLYFTNLCLGYRKQNNVESMNEYIVADANAFLPETLKIIHPDVVFCLGPRVYEIACEALGLEHVSGKTSIDITGYGNDTKTVRLYEMPHCGSKGLKELPMEQQIEAWRKVVRDMTDNGIQLDV